MQMPRRTTLDCNQAGASVSDDVGGEWKPYLPLAAPPPALPVCPVETSPSESFEPTRCITFEAVWKACHNRLTFWCCVHFG